MKIIFNEWTGGTYAGLRTGRNIINDFKDGISHGILVGNLTYALAKRLGMSEDEAYELKLAGMIHDVGKLKLSPYLYGRNSDGLSIEE